MKKKIIALAVLGILCIFSVAGQTADIDAAIQQASTEISDIIRPFLPVGVVPLSFQSPTNELSAYVLREMALSLERVRLATIIPRHEIDIVLRNANLSASSNVNDTAAVQLSQSFISRASFAVTGTFERVVDIYRFRIRLINLHTGRLASATTIDVRETPHLRQLLGLDRPAPVATPAPAPAPAPAPRPAPAATPAPQNNLANGTYTLFPRPRARSSGGQWLDVYVSKVEVDSRFITIYFENRPTAGDGHGQTSGFDQGATTVLTNLDTPRIYTSCTASTCKPALIRNTVIYSVFPRIEGRRFSLEDQREGISIEEIVLGQPD